MRLPAPDEPCGPAGPTPPAGLRLPAYDGRWIGAVLPSAAQLLTGRTPPGTIAGTPGLQPPTGSGEAHTVVVVLADGLGYHQMKQRSGHFPFLTALPVVRLRTGAPSTTAASLGSLGTGLPPGQTGLAGYSLLLPGSAEPFSLLAWDTTVQPEAWQPHPTVFEWLGGAGVTVTSIGKQRFAASGLTRAALRGGTYVPASGTQAIEATVQAARQRGPGLIYLYWGDIDKAGHTYGWRSPDWGAAVEEFDAAMASLARSLPRGVSLAITADHGMIDYDPARRYDLADNEELARGVRAIAGEPRAVHVYCQPGATAEVAVRWREVLGPDGWVVTKQEVHTTGLLGPTITPQCDSALGDLFVAMTGHATAVDSRTQKQGMLTMLGHHGSLTAAESDVPLWVVRCGS